MKINSISFGQTYLMPSLKYMSPENRDKLAYSYALGELYPNDIYLGATHKGDLTVEITRTFLYDHLILNNQVPFTPKNIAAYVLAKKAANAGRYIHGNPYPVQKNVIKYLDYIPEDMLSQYIASEVEEYNHKYAHLFIN